MHPIRRPALAAALVLLGGCATSPTAGDPPPPGLHEVVVPVGRPAEAAPFRFWGDDLSTQDMASFAVRAQARARAAGRDVSSRTALLLSGGGPDGAYAAGLLNGWSRRGDRPDFDLVTGVSVGALIAPFAFVGSEDGDAPLRAIFTLTEREEEVAEIALFSALFGALGVADSQPLMNRIRALVDEEMLERIAEGHREGRALLIATTNIDAGRPVIWSMGEIAAAGRLDLFHRVMLASASIPGAFPPVPIAVTDGQRTFDELHVDGGVTRSVILGPTNLRRLARLARDGAPEAIFYVIQNNALIRPYRPVERSIPAIASRSLSVLIRGQTDGDLLRIWLDAEAVGAEFRLSFVPRDFGAASAAAFDPGYMRELFAFAEAEGEAGIDWLSEPPGMLTRSEVEALAPPAIFVDEDGTAAAPEG